MYARVATHFQEAANTILSRMKDRWACPGHFDGMYALFNCPLLECPLLLENAQCFLPQSMHELNLTTSTSTFLQLCRLATWNSGCWTSCFIACLLHKLSPLMLACRFTERFSRDEDALPRRWGPSENISVAMQKAYQDVSVLLAQIAVLRLGESKASFHAYGFQHLHLCSGF